MSVLDYEATTEFQSMENQLVSDEEVGSFEVVAPEPFGDAVGEEYQVTDVSENEVLPSVAGEFDESANAEVAQVDLPVAEDSQVALKAPPKARTRKAVPVEDKTPSKTVPGTGKTVAELNTERTAQAATDKEKKEADRAESRRLLDEKAAKDKAEKDRKQAEKDAAALVKAEEDKLLYEEPYTVTPLTPEQNARREELEAVALKEKALSKEHMTNAAIALSNIIDEGLHHDFISAAEYVRSRFGEMSTVHANRKLVFGNIAGELVTISNKMVEGGEITKEEQAYQFSNISEGLLRPMGKLGSKQKIDECWKRVVKKCKEQSAAATKAQGKEVIIKPTAKMVSAEVDEMLGKGKTAVGLDAVVETNAKAAGKSRDKAWRSAMIEVYYVDYKGRRYQMTKRAESDWLAEIFILQPDSTAGSVWNKRACVTGEHCLVFLDIEKETFDKEEDEAFAESKSLPTAEYFDPNSGKTILPPVNLSPQNVSDEDLANGLHNRENDGDDFGN